MGKENDFRKNECIPSIELSSGLTIFFVFRVLPIIVWVCLTLFLTFVLSAVLWLTVSDFSVCIFKLISVNMPLGWTYEGVFYLPTAHNETI